MGAVSPVVDGLSAELDERLLRWECTNFHIVQAWSETVKGLADARKATLNIVDTGFFRSTSQSLGAGARARVFKSRDAAMPFQAPLIGSFCLAGATEERPTGGGRGGNGSVQTSWL